MGHGLAIEGDGESVGAAGDGAVFVERAGAGFEIKHGAGEIEVGRGKEDLFGVGEGEESGVSVAGIAELEECGDGFGGATGETALVFGGENGEPVAETGGVHEGDGERSDAAMEAALAAMHHGTGAFGGEAQRLFDDAEEFLILTSCRQSRRPPWLRP